MRLNKQWEKEWHDIEVPKESVYQAIDAGFKSQEEPPSIEATPKKIVQLKKYRKYLLSAAILTILAGGAYVSLRQPKTRDTLSKEAPQAIQNKQETQELAPETGTDGLKSKAATSFQDDSQTKGTVEFDDGSETETATASPSETNGQTMPNKIIKTYTLGKETNDFNKSNEAIKKAIAKHQGYVSQSNSYSLETDENLMQADYEIRVPKEQAADFIAGISAIGETVSSSESAVDQSLYYSDNQSRIEALKIEETALLKLLEKSENVQDMLTIQDRLSTIRSEKEGLIRQNSLVDNQVAETTIYLTLTEVKKITKESSSSIGNTVKSNWQNQLVFWSKTGKQLVVFLLSNALYLVIIIIIVSVSWLIYRKKKKGGRAHD